MPGTKIPVVDPSALAEQHPDAILLFVPDLISEVRATYPEVEANGGRWVDATALGTDLDGMRLLAPHSDPSRKDTPGARGTPGPRPGSRTAVMPDTQNRALDPIRTPITSRPQQREKSRIMAKLQYHSGPRPDSYVCGQCPETSYRSGK